MNRVAKLIMVMAIVLTTASVAEARPLSVGSSGSDVSSLQTWLINNGYTIPLIEKGVASKGYFGEQTKTAVMMYQEDKGLSTTGVIDSEGYASNKLGAVSSPENYTRFFFNSGLSSGGNLATTSAATLATYTTAARDFNGTPSVIQWNNGVNMTISISSTSTFAYVPKVGDVANIYFRNASTTAGSAITFAAVDANVDMQFAQGGNLVLNGLDWAKVTLIRTSTNLVTFIFDEMTEAD